MKINITIFGLFLLSILILSGCAQQQTKYVCPDGSTVSDISLCSKQQTSFCGDEKCDSSESCGTCISDCSKCRLSEDDIVVSLKWKISGMIEGVNWGKCGEYNAGDIDGSIILSSKIKEGSYICKSSFGNEREAQWSFYGNHYKTEGFFALSKPLRETQQGEICCYSDSPSPDFCKTLVLSAYC